MDTQPDMAVADAVAPEAQPAVDPQPIDAADFYRDESEQPPEGGEAEPGEEPEPEGGDPDPIDAPVSWAKDAKETFANLPREAQEIIAKRESEREQFVSAKAREAATTRQAVEREATTQLQQIMQHHAAQLQQYAGQFDVSPPDTRLLQSADPQHHAAYYEQDRQYRLATAQREQLTQQSQQARQQAEMLNQQQEEQQRAELHAELVEKVPEWAEPEKRAKLIAELEPIAAAFGYPRERMAYADATDIVALKLASEKFAKADKYDQLMKQRMQPVRAAKQIPPTARAGAPGGQAAPTSVAAQLYPNDVRR